METIVSVLESIKVYLLKIYVSIKEKFIKTNTEMTQKKDIDFKNLSILFFSLVSIFMAMGLFMPSEDGRVFREVAQSSVAKTQSFEKNDIKSNEKSKVSKIWSNEGSAYRNYGEGRVQGQINYNTAMVMGENKGNSKFEIPAGTKMRIQILDKFLVSQDGTPVIAKLLDSVTSMSGNQIPEGSLLYGEAIYQKASSKALINFKQVSYPNGSQHDISAQAVGEDGMLGLAGAVKSDSIKNSIGQVVTNFVGTMASGSVERDFMGNSKGGNTNGLYQAISEAAKDRAQKFGESLKESREWIEVESGVICEAVLIAPYKLINLDLSNGQGL